ncbi:arylalkylamine N-acetyltransferase 1-like isoform X1 [Planococcus citri]|uniref:arylalkylamine N-acetyltransferase 1-like isoform X1 n=2 Tax=Planococcus citri TaxID=170843 RepID=UPI0031F7482F
METETLPILSAAAFGNANFGRSYFRSDADTVGNYRSYSMDEIPKKTAYTIIPITNKDVEKVSLFLRKFFFRDEPLNVAVELLVEPNATCQELEEYCVSCIPEGLSIMAVSPSGYLLGVCLNGSLTRDSNENDNSKDHSIEDCANPKFKKILQLLSTVTKLSDVFGHFPTAEKILDLRILSVDESCRGQGIAKALIDKTIEIAKEHNFPLIKVDCSSHYSAKAVSRLGFQSIFTLKYDDYVNSEGEKIFITKPPHTCVKTFVMPLSA